MKLDEVTEEERVNLFARGVKLSDLEFLRALQLTLGYNKMADLLSEIVAKLRDEYEN